MVSTKLRAFHPSKVRMLPGLFDGRFELNRRYVSGLQDENLLKPFYLEAGMWDYGAKPENIHWGWESPTCMLRGHFMGHWLSAVARISASTGDTALKGRLDKIVSEIGRCQEENGGEWAGPIPEKYLDWIARGKRVWAPHYVVHKVLMGLYDAYRVSGNEQALDILKRYAKWLHRWTKQFTRDQMDDILEVETGGMLEAVADLYGVTKKTEHLDLIERYDRRRLFDRLLAGEDALLNMHANTTIPEAQGAARAYEVTGDKRYHDIAAAYWDFAVTKRGYYCTGGQTCGEVWSPPFELSARLSEKTQEHCTVYNMMRLADYLYRWTGDVTYADYWERNLYNGVLAQQHPADGRITYFLPLKAGGVKKWGTLTEDFWCCHGTLVQAHTLYLTSTYFEDDDGLVVAQYIPTELSWERSGVGVKVTQTEDTLRRETRRPLRKALDLAIECDRPVEFTLKVRLPWWLAGEAAVTVNGLPQEFTSKPGTYFTVKRVWHSDNVHVELPRKLWTEPLPDAPDTVAFMEGPMVLAGLCEEARTFTGDPSDPGALLTPDAEREWGSWFPRWRTKGQDPNVRLVPLYEVRDEPYTVYFQVQKPGK